MTTNKCPVCRSVKPDHMVWMNNADDEGTKTLMCPYAQRIAIERLANIRENEDYIYQQNQEIERLKAGIHRALNGIEEVENKLIELKKANPDTATDTNTSASESTKAIP